MSFPKPSLRQFVLAIAAASFSLAVIAKEFRDSDQVRRISSVSLSTIPSTDFDYEGYWKRWAARWHDLMGRRPVVGAIVEVRKMNEFVEFAKGHEYLEYVAIEGMDGRNIDDLIPLLAQLQSVKEVSVMNCSVSDFSLFNEMVNLEGLELSRCESTDWLSLARVDGLCWVRIFGSDSADDISTEGLTLWRERRQRRDTLQTLMPECQVIMRHHYHGFGYRSPLW